MISYGWVVFISGFFFVLQIIVNHTDDEPNGGDSSNAKPETEIHKKVG